MKTADERESAEPQNGWLECQIHGWWHPPGTECKQCKRDRAVTDSVESRGSATQKRAQDIVERLRDQYHETGGLAILLLAADEILALRSRLAEAEALLRESRESFYVMPLPLRSRIDAFLTAPPPPGSTAEGT